MNINQLTDTQLFDQLDNLCTTYLATCELDHDLPELERTLDAHYHEANRRGLL